MTLLMLFPLLLRAFMVPGRAGPLVRLAHNPAPLPSSSAPVLSGNDLRNLLQTGAQTTGLLGKIVVEMLDEAAVLAPAKTGMAMMDPNVVQYRLINTFRLLFSSLDFIACSIMNDPSEDFCRLDINMLPAGSDEKKMAKALQRYYLPSVSTSGKEYRIRPMSIWNSFKDSSPSIIALQVKNNKMMFRVGKVAFLEEDLLKYVESANQFGKLYYLSQGL